VGFGSFTSSSSLREIADIKRELSDATSAREKVSREFRSFQNDLTDLKSEVRNFRNNHDRDPEP
jgi:chromosome segregation ATPase